MWKERVRNLQSIIVATVVFFLAGCSGGGGGLHKALRQNLPTAGQETKVLAVYQPWFGAPEHINVGYSSDDISVIRRQVRDAKDLGISGFVVDWYGESKSYYDHNYALLQGEAARQQFQTAIMYDEPKGQPEDSTQQAIANLDYVNQRYISSQAQDSSAYLRLNGHPVIFIWPDSQRTNWDMVRKHVQQWESPPLLIVRFSTTSYPQDFDGFYAWVDAGQDGWAADGSHWGKPYLNNFYKTMQSQYPGKLMVSAAWPGFDDSKASWGTHRLIAQRCGKTFQDTLTEFHHDVSPDHPVPFLLIETWNDYEEGTAVERGLNKCSGGESSKVADLGGKDNGERSR